jgi:hypothetical protein
MRLTLSPSSPLLPLIEAPVDELGASPVDQSAPWLSLCRGIGLTVSLLGNRVKAVRLFFFEKKNQKTFTNGSSLYPG